MEDYQGRRPKWKTVRMEKSKFEDGQNGKNQNGR